MAVFFVAPHHGDQPARRERIGRGVCHPELFLHRDDVVHDRDRAFPYRDRFAWRTVVNPPEIEHVDELTGISLFLLLHAFSSGTTAMTGVEAISNGITAFKEPRSRNAGITLIWMACVLGVLFIGISYLTREIQAVPSETETVISQLARTIFNGQGILYLGAILGTTVILILAANTAFAGFPRLSALLAGDGFMPRQLTYRGSRLVYSYGIIALGAAASILIVIFQASVTRLIPLYAIGVFLSFTLAQAGMTRRWWRSGKLDTNGPTSKITYRRASFALRQKMARQDDQQRAGRALHRAGGRRICRDKVPRRGMDRLNSHPHFDRRSSCGFTVTTPTWRAASRSKITASRRPTTRAIA
jgi:hypothetical protein